MATATRTSTEVVQRGFDVLDDRDRDAFVELHAEDAVLHESGEVYRGVDEIVDHEFEYFEAFPDLALSPKLVFADGELVAARWTMTGTHAGAYRGMEPTGKEVELPLLGLFRVEDGRIAEAWLEVNQLELLRQLGVVEPRTE